MITAVAIVALAAIVVTGAAVRLSGSGMGCPTWPSCEDGSLVPRGATGSHGWIEFLNRAFTGAVSVAVVLAVLGALWRVPYRADLTRWATGLVVGVFAQALLGGIVVWLHVAPVAVMGHYLLSAVLVWNAVVLHHKAGEPDVATRPARPRATAELRRLGLALVAVGGVVLVTGTVVTGAGPHGGDEAADRLDLAVSTAARIHGGSVWVFLALTLVTLWIAHRGHADPAALQRGRVLVAVLVAQATIGYVQYFSDVPELLVGAHVLGSVVVWIGVLRFHLGLTAAGAGDRLASDDERRVTAGLVGVGR